MIISVSRRTDIPAFYSQWFIRRVRAGYCTVPNPFNPAALSVVSLRPEDVDAFMFCSRNPQPLLRYLPELDAAGYRYYFHQTIVANPRVIDPHSPTPAAAVRTFCRLSERIGSQRVIWRYDPIVLSEVTPPEHHIENFGRLASCLRGATERVVISILDPYKKIKARMAALAEQGIHAQMLDQIPGPVLADLMARLQDIARRNGMEMVSCAEDPLLAGLGVRPGKCIDDELIYRVYGTRVNGAKNPAMRPACGCVVSRDIGMYDACLFGCTYCYATTSFTRARDNHEAHDPASPSLLGWHEAPAGALQEGAPRQLNLFS